MIKDQAYKPKQFNLRGLKGISDKTMEMHFGLYERYVAKTNELNEKINQLLADGEVDQEEMPAIARSAFMNCVMAPGLRTTRSDMRKSSSRDKARGTGR